MTTVASNARTALTPSSSKLSPPAPPAQGHDARLGRAPQLPGLRREPFAFTGELLGFFPCQPDPGPASAVRQPVQRELRKTEPLAGVGLTTWTSWDRAQRQGETHEAGKAKPMPLSGSVSRREARRALCRRGDQPARRARTWTMKRVDTLPRSSAAPDPQRERKRPDSIAMNWESAQPRTTHSRAASVLQHSPRHQLRTSAWNRARRSRVTGPALPAPMIRPSSWRIATISLAVPVKKASSAVYMS